MKDDAQIIIFDQWGRVSASLPGSGRAERLSDICQGAECIARVAREKRLCYPHQPLVPEEVPWCSIIFREFECFGGMYVLVSNEQRRERLADPWLEDKVRVVEPGNDSEICACRVVNSALRVYHMMRSDNPDVCELAAAVADVVGIELESNNGKRISTATSCTAQHGCHAAVECCMGQDICSADEKCYMGHSGACLNELRGAAVENGPTDAPLLTAQLLLTFMSLRRQNCRRAVITPFDGTNMVRLECPGLGPGAARSPELMLCRQLSDKYNAIYSARQSFDGRLYVRLGASMHNSSTLGIKSGINLRD